MPKSEDVNFSAIYVGIVKSAITKIKPTTFMATTTVREQSTNLLC